MMRGGPNLLLAVGGFYGVVGLEHYQLVGYAEVVDVQVLISLPFMLPACICAGRIRLR
jgi:hypothetical protein